VYEIASQPAYVVNEKNLQACAKIMAERGLGFLPVVDNEGRLRDACTELDYGLELVNDRRPARCYSTHELVMGDPSDTLIEALGIMIEKGFRRLPLRQGNEYYMATMIKLLAAIAREPKEDTLLRELAYYATPAPRLSYENASVGEAAELIISTPERALLLIDEENLARAIMTERDLLRAYLDRGGETCRAHS
jgi:CBS domain-containing protein